MAVALTVSLLLTGALAAGTTLETPPVAEPEPFVAQGGIDAATRELFNHWRAGQASALAPTGTLALPDDPLLPSQWGTSQDGVDATSAWRVTRGDRGIIVAVLDSGIEADHEDLAAAVLPGYDFYNDDPVPEEDACGHGTHVAGIIGAVSGNGAGTAGVAETTILPVKVLGDSGDGCRGSFNAVAKAIRYATDEGAHVINFSFGCPVPCYDAGVKAALQYAHGNGVLLVGSAGNETGGPVTFPANQPEVLAVSALNSDGTWAAYSAKGPEVELLAPGTSILSTYRDGTYQYMTGTSMAAPHVAGVAALVLSLQPMEPDQLRAHLLDNARDLGLAGEVQGAGAVDAAAAVQSLAAS